MKNTLRIICVLLSFVLYSCQDEDLYLPETAGEGTLQLNVNVGKENLINARSKATVTEAFQVSLLSQANDTVYQWSDRSEVPESISLRTGIYYVKVSSGTLASPAFDAVYYTGQSAFFEIGDGQVAAVEVTARLANTKVSISFSDSLQKDFYDYFVRITDEDDHYLTFSKDEIRAGYFNGGNLTAYVRLSYVSPEGDSLFYEKTQRIEGAEANDHIHITIKANLHYGDGLFSVNTSDAVNKKEVVIGFDQPAKSEAPAQQIYTENLVYRGNGSAFASSYASDSMQYARPAYDAKNDTIKTVYDLPLPEKAFDGKFTHWTSDSRQENLPQWLGFDFGAGQEKTIRQYSLQVTQWGTPESWMFQGSHDGLTWQTLDEQQDKSLATFETTSFEIDNQQSYRYYRLLVTKATGLTNSTSAHEVNFVLIRELEMRELIQ